MYFLDKVLYKQYVVNYNCSHFIVNKLRGQIFIDHMFWLAPDTATAGSTGRAVITCTLQTCHWMPIFRRKENEGGSWNALVTKTAIQSMLVTKMNAVVAESRIRLPESLLEASRQNLEKRKVAKFTSHQNKVL
jgi:hypothetical protein